MSVENSIQVGVIPQESNDKRGGVDTPPDSELFGVVGCRCAMRINSVSNLLTSFDPIGLPYHRWVFNNSVNLIASGNNDTYSSTGALPFYALPMNFFVDFESTNFTILSSNSIPPPDDFTIHTTIQCYLMWGNRPETLTLPIPYDFVWAEGIELGSNRRQFITEKFNCAQLTEKPKN